MLTLTAWIPKDQMENPETGTDMEAAGISDGTQGMVRGGTAPGRQTRTPVLQIRLTQMQQTERHLRKTTSCLKSEQTGQDERVTGGHTAQKRMLIRQTKHFKVKILRIRG